MFKNHKMVNKDKTSPEYKEEMKTKEKLHKKGCYCMFYDKDGRCMKCKRKIK